MVMLLVEEKIKEIEDKYQSEKRENEDLITKQKSDFENKLKELEINMKRVKIPMHSHKLIVFL